MELWYNKCQFIPMPYIFIKDETELYHKLWNQIQKVTKLSKHSFIVTFIIMIIFYGTQT